METRLRVWDPLVRVLHWSLVSALLLSWLGTFAIAGAHQPAGYVALALVLLRLLWGGIGSKYARFGQFVRGPRATCAYLIAVLRRREPRHVGHNPLGAYMVLALLANVAGLGLTGWLYTTDRLWGDATVELLHLVLAWALLALAVLHVAGVLFTSVRQRENLIAAMISGDKSGPIAGEAAGHEAPR
jgi:cytochrome b